MQERQPTMVETHQMQDRRVDVVDMGDVLGRPEADRIGAPMTWPPFTPPPGHPHREAVRVVVAARRHLAHRRPAEFAPPR